MVPEQVWDWHYCSYRCFFFFWGGFLFVLSFPVWNFLWLLEEVLTLLCFFFIARKEISLFLWKICVVSLAPTCSLFVHLSSFGPFLWTGVCVSRGVALPVFFYSFPPQFFFRTVLVVKWYKCHSSIFMLMRNMKN
jgi:hypothetical protein